jgi:hypothetical protein
MSTDRATPTLIPNDSREAFEAVVQMEAGFVPFDLSKTNGRYWNESLNQRWETWQSALAWADSAQAQESPAGSTLVDRLNSLLDDMRGRVTGWKAIENARDRIVELETQRQAMAEIDAEQDKRIAELERDLASARAQTATVTTGQGGGYCSQVVATACTKHGVWPCSICGPEGYGPSAARAGEGGEET